MQSSNLEHRILDWNDEGNHIQKILLDYDWEYREKICAKCPLEIQKKLECFRVNNYKNNIQETHCRKMDKARTQKYRKLITKFIQFHPLSNR